MNPGGFTGGTNKAQAYILLHELAHFLGAEGFKSDFGNPQAQADNEKRVKQNCGKTINAAKAIN